MARKQFTPEEDYMSGWKFGVRNNMLPQNASMTGAMGSGFGYLGETWRKGCEDGIKALRDAEKFAKKLPEGK